MVYLGHLKIPRLIDWTCQLCVRVSCCVAKRSWRHPIEKSLVWRRRRRFKASDTTSSAIWWWQRGDVQVECPTAFFLRLSVMLDMIWLVSVTAALMTYKLVRSQDEGRRQSSDFHQLLCRILSDNDDSTVRFCDGCWISPNGVSLFEGGCRLLVKPYSGVC